MQLFVNTVEKAVQCPPCLSCALTIARSATLPDQSIHLVRVLKMQRDRNLIRSKAAPIYLADGNLGVESNMPKTSEEARHSGRRAVGLAQRSLSLGNPSQGRVCWGWRSISNEPSAPSPLSCWGLQIVSMSVEKEHIPNFVAANRHRRTYFVKLFPTHLRQINRRETRKSKKKEHWEDLCGHWGVLLLRRNNL